MSASIILWYLTKERKKGLISTERGKKVSKKPEKWSPLHVSVTVLQAHNPHVDPTSTC